MARATSAASVTRVLPATIVFMSPPAARRPRSRRARWRRRRRQIVGAVGVAPARQLVLPLLDVMDVLRDPAAAVRAQRAVQRQRAPRLSVHRPGTAVPPRPYLIFRQRPPVARQVAGAERRQPQEVRPAVALPRHPEPAL